MRLHWFQHVPFEELGAIAPWAQARGHAVSVTRLFLDEPLPSIDTFDWLVIMGGPMGVYDGAQFPWLKTETEFIGQAIARGKRVLGICLGAQLIAAALGARVYPNKQKEIGWLPIRLTPEGTRSEYFDAAPAPFPVFHWHGDTFDLPARAVRLAESDACANQAFQYGDRVVGLQFHLEVTPEGVERLIGHCGHELVDGPTIQTREQLRAGRSEIGRLNGRMERLLDRLEKTGARS